MADGDEIVQRFRVVDDGATSTLGGIDAKIKDVKASTKAVADETKKHSEAMNEGRHKAQLFGIGMDKMQHISRLLQETMGSTGRAIMGVVYPMMMFGPAVGIAAGAFTLLKETLSEQAEAAQKAKEKYEALIEAARKFQEQRKVRAETYELGEKGKEAQDEERADNAAKMAGGKRLKELREGRTSGYASKSTAGKFGEHLDFFWEQAKSVFSGETEEEWKARIEGEKGELEAQNNRMRIQEETARKNKEEKFKPWNDINKEANKALNKIEIQSSYARGENLDLLQKQFDILHGQVQAHKEIAKHEMDEVAKSEMQKEIQAEELALANKYNQLDDKRFEREQKLNQIKNSPGAFSTAEQKAKFSENAKYENEVREAQKIDADIGQIAQRHKDNLLKITMDAADQIMMAKAEVNAQELRNDGKKFDAERAIAEAHYKDAFDKHKGDAANQLIDKEKLAADLNKIAIDENNDEKAFTASNRADILRLKGDSYAAERVQLEEWLRSEKEKHVDHEDELQALYSKKAADINWREKQERTKTLGGYAAELATAVLGQGAGSALKMQQDHAAKQAEILHGAHPEDAALDEQAYEAKVRRMKHESDLELLGKKTVGFSDIGGAWESFAAGLNKNPKEQEQLNEMKTTNSILTRIADSFGKGATGEIVE